MSKKSSGISFFKRIIASFFSKGDSEAENKRLLKDVAKKLGHSGYKYYKSGSDQILPAFGKFFFETYKTISSAQTAFHAQPNPNAYKNLVAEYALSEKQKKIEEELSEESIQTLSKNMPFQQLKSKIKNDLTAFCSAFDAKKVADIDDLYTKVVRFREFCLYDFYFVLKKFDSTIKEFDFNKNPKFSPIDASYIVEDLKNFTALIYSLPLEDDWSAMFTMFKKVKDAEPVKQNQWNKLMAKLSQLKDGAVLDMMIQLITKNPSYETKAVEKKEHMLESYIEKVRDEAKSALKQLENQQQNSKIDGLVSQIFGTTAISITKNYTEQRSAPFEKKSLGSFTYAKPINYMKAFLVEFVKKDVREYADLILIRGQWTTQPLSAQMSDDYHKMLEISDAITVLDDRVAEDAEVGAKMKTLLPRADRDKDSGNIIHRLLEDCNSEARDNLVQGTKAMVSFAKTLKVVIEDHKKNRPEIISNWKELERFSEHPIDESGTEIYKRIYLFVNLMQNFLK